MGRVRIVALLLASWLAAAAPAQEADRDLWVSTMVRIARPVWANLSRATLNDSMPFESVSRDPARRVASRLEAVGRTLCGMAPWLELGADSTAEGRLRGEFLGMVAEGLRRAVDPSSPDYLTFGRGISQSLVDAAFLAQGLLRAPRQVWLRLDSVTRRRLVAELERTRTVKPNETNWLLFASTVEAALLEFTGRCDTARLCYGVNRFVNDGWYKGDGWFGDGAEFHFDYYNSIVIHPMLTDVLGVMVRHGLASRPVYDRQVRRLVRQSAILERLISPEGTYPVVGRSITYRFGVFHALAQAALMGVLPRGLASQAGPALTAVIRRQAGAPGTFDSGGWLRVGFAGSQPRMGEKYINTGSEYMCMAVFLPLGLPVDDAFWRGPHRKWTSLRAWEGADVGADHALRDSREK